MYREVDEEEDEHFDFASETWVYGKKTESYVTYEKDFDCCSIRINSDWPPEYTPPPDFCQECDEYYEKAICKACVQTVSEELIERAQALAKKAKEEKKLAEEKAKEEQRLTEEQAKIAFENSKICCPRCNVRFPPYELSRPASSRLPWFWVIKSYKDVDICCYCAGEIIAAEHKRYLHAKKQCSEVVTYPATYKGDKHIDNSIVKNNVESGRYRNRDDALNELKLRAYLDGFNVVFDCTWIHGTEVEDADSGNVDSPNYIRGIHKYSVWSAKGSFGKRGGGAG